MPVICVTEGKGKPMAKGETKKKGGCLKVVLIVCAAFFALGIVIGMFGGGGESVDEPTIDDLTALRDEAMDIQEYDCAAGTYDAVLQAFNGAQNVINNADGATPEQIAEAYEALTAAMEQVVPIDEAEKTAENAALLARWYTAGQSSYSRDMVIYNIVNMKDYDAATAEAGVDASGIDWDEEAFQYAMNMIDLHPDMTVAELIADMTDMYYTDENIAFALVQAGIAL